MFIALAVVAYISFLPPATLSSEQKAALAAVAMLVGYGALHCRDSVLVNPHPLFWRVVSLFNIYIYTYIYVYMYTLYIYASAPASSSLACGNCLKYVYTPAGVYIYIC